MRLGIGSYTFTWAVGVPGQAPARPLDAMGLLDKAGALGVRVVHICDNLPLHALTEAQLDALAERASHLGLRIEAGTRGIQPEHLRTYISLAARLGSPILRVVIDSPGHRPSADEAAEALRRLHPEWERASLCLAIENHDRFTARELRRIVESVGGRRIGICLDTANSFGAREGVREVVDELADLTVSLHVKDFEIRRVDHQMGFVIEGRPAGQGQLDVPWLLDRLRLAGRNPNAILELWTPPAASLDETIAREDSWAKQSVKYLRTLMPD